MSPVLPVLDERYNHRLIHSGQHYSRELDSLFFEELSLRKPDLNLAVGSGTPSAQVGRMMEGLERYMKSFLPDLIVVQGDTNTALAGALVAAHYRPQGVRLAHVEAGMRSGQYDQLEEINRVVIDRLSDLLLVPNESDVPNLTAEGLSGVTTAVVGSTVFESCTRMLHMTDGYRPAIVSDLPEHGFALATFHRRESVDDPSVLRSLCMSLEEIALDIPIIFLRHPRTASMMERYQIGLCSPGIRLLPPVGYRELVALVRSARFCLTDSGGLQEEAAYLRVPTIVLRDQTEHRRYVEKGIHVLVGTSRERVVQAAGELLNERAWSSRRGIALEFPEHPSQAIAAAVDRFFLN